MQRWRSPSNRARPLPSRLALLCATPFDLLVIGAGIHGAFAAWDAALRGLRVALIDRGDFGGEASGNSLRILHGGFRYLQTGLGVILAFVGIKMTISYWWHMPIAYSLSFIALVLVVSIFASLREERLPS